MASCYFCGASGASSRRRVYTGDSHRLYFGRRVSASSGMHFGLRTLCYSCALQHDKSENTWSMIKWGAAIVVICLVLFGGNSHKSKSKTPRKVSGIVTTTDTSNIRSQPSTKSEIVGTAPNDSELSVIEDKGSWVKVEYGNNGNKVTGWISKSLVNSK